MNRLVIAALFLCACGRVPVDGAIDRSVSCAVTGTTLMDREIQLSVRSTFSGGTGTRARLNLDRCSATSATVSPAEFIPQRDLDCTGWSERNTWCVQSGTEAGSGTFRFGVRTDGRSRLSCEAALTIIEGEGSQPYDIDGALDLGCDLSNL